jgi:hypothetical protein
MLGHTSQQIIKNSIDTGSITAKISPTTMKHLELHSCTSCALSKPGRKRSHVQRTTNTATRALQRLQMDVIPVPSEFCLKVKQFADSSTINARYFLLIIDEYSRRSYAIPMNSTSDIRDAFDTFMDEVNLDKRTRSTLGVADKPNDCKIEFIWSDKASYFTGILKEHLKTSAVTSKNFNQIIVLDTPHEAEQQYSNGIVESRWCQIKTKIYSVMAESGYYIWSYAMCYANNIVNLTAHTEYNKLQPSPYYRLFKKPVPLRNFFPFKQFSSFFPTKSTRGTLETRHKKVHLAYYY